MTGAVPLLSERDRLEARKLIESEGLRFETDADDIVGLYDGERLVATGSRAGYVLKMLAIAPSQQGGDALGELVTLLMQRGMNAGHETFFVYTRPEHAPSFERLNFRLLVTHGMAALLEIGLGIGEYLDTHRALVRPGRNGAVVVNGNPVHARPSAPRRDGRPAGGSPLPLRRPRGSVGVPVRRALSSGAGGDGAPPERRAARHVAVRGQRRHVPVVLPEAARRRGLLQMQVDVRLFALRARAAVLGAARFVGHEPYCATTAAYNRTMAEVLRRVRHRAGRRFRGWRTTARPSAPAACASALGRGDLDRVASWCPRPRWRSCAPRRGTPSFGVLAGAGEGQ